MSDRNKASKNALTVAKKPSGVPAAASVNRIKILTVGSGGTGKSCLVKRFCEERFVSKYIATIGVDYGVRIITF
jgi:DnaJ family protein C protein 27